MRAEICHWPARQLLCHLLTLSPWHPGIMQRYTHGPVQKSQLECQSKMPKDAKGLQANT